MDRLKDRLKELVDDHKIKIILSLLVLIGFLMVTLFILIGRRDDNPNMDATTNLNQSLSSHKYKDTASTNQQRNHFQSTFIDIEGAVKRPGVYQFTNNMRIDDAVNLADGLNRSADRKHINLAKKLTDQQTVYIPVRGEIKGLPVNTNNDGSSLLNDKATNPQGASNDSNKVSLNTANVTQLESVNGIGDKRAQKIIDYRKDHGNFKQVSDLKNVSGIGDKFLSNIKDHVTV